MSVQHRFGRRGFLLSAIGFAGLAGCDGTGGAAPSAGPAPVAHQPGVVTPAPAHSTLAAFDVRAADRAQLAEIFRALRPAGAADLTVSVGASLFDSRFGLRPPRLLMPMPAFRADVLDPQWCHGDLLLQVSAPDRGPIDATLAGTAPGLASRWRIDGFRTVDRTGRNRNLFNFTEGAGNPDPSDPSLMDRLVWIQPGDDEPEWCTGGTYQVVRLIRLATPTWDAETTTDQERVFGRRKDTGAPLGQSRESDLPDYAKDPSGRIIPLDAHIRRANPRTPDSQAHRILRRGYSYRRTPAAPATSDAGQIFICYQRDVERGFATIQRRLAGEALEKYTLPFGGGYYFVLPGAGGDHLGRTMLEASR